MSANGELVLSPITQQQNEQLIARFILYMRAERGASANTLESYALDLRGFAASLSYPLNAVTRGDVQTYLSSIIASGKSGSTAARCACCLRTFYHLLMDDDEITTDPTLNLRSPKTWKKVPQAVGELDIDKMIASLGNSPLEIRNKAMLLLFFGSGLRSEELAALKIPDLDFDTQIVKIWNGKGGKDARLPLSSYSIQAIQRYLSEVRPMLAEVGERGRIQTARSPYLFLGRRYGNRMTRMQVYNIIRDLSRKSLGQAYSPINLRHGYATALTKGGADLRDVQVLMRHSYISTTERYVHTDIDYIRSFYGKHPRTAAAGNRESTIPDVVQGKKPQRENDTSLPRGLGATHGYHRP